MHNSKRAKTPKKSQLYPEEKKSQPKETKFYKATLQCQSLKGLEANKARPDHPNGDCQAFRTFGSVDLGRGWCSEVEKLRIRRFKLDSPCLPSIIYIKTPTTLTFGARKYVVRKSRAFVCPDCRLLYNFFQLPSCICLSLLCF